MAAECNENTPPASSPPAVPRRRDSQPDRRYSPVAAQIAPAVAQTLSLVEANVTVKRSRLERAVKSLYSYAYLNGIALTPNLVCDDALIEEYLARAPMSGASKGTYRSALLQCASVIRTGLPVATASRYAQSPPRAPYTDDEVRRLWSWSRSLRHERLRRNARVILATGVGCGITTAALCKATGRDVRRAEDGLVEVSVNDHRGARLLIASRHWEARLLELATQAGAGTLLSTKGRLTTRTVSALTDDLHQHAHDVPLLNVSRCRSTWIVAQVNAGTPWDVIAGQAGIENLDAIARYQPFFTTTPVEQRRHLLAGKGRRR